MTRCPRCGKENLDDNVKLCPDCDYDFIVAAEAEAAIPKEPPVKHKTDLTDNPILAFILGIAGMILPFFILSIIAIVLAVRPAKPKYKPVSHVALGLGILGIIVSILLLILIIMYRVN